MVADKDAPKMNGENVKPTRKSDNFTRASFVSKLCYCWMLPTFLRGAKRELDLEDLSLPGTSDLSERLADKLERNWFLEEEKAKLAGRPPSLRRALFKTFIWQHVPDGLLAILYIMVLMPLQPTVLGMLLKYWNENDKVSWSASMCYAGLLVVMVFVGALVNYHMTRRTNQFGMRMRIACCSLMYRKVVRMDTAALNESAAGKVVNLLSNDVNRFDSVFLFVPYLYISPIQVSIISYLMYSEIGVSGLIGVAIITLQTLPIQIYMSHITASLRLKVANATDARVKLMDEIISGIQVIKMYAWEKPFEAVVTASRKKEIDLVTKTSYLRGVYLSFMVFTERFTLYCTLLTYTLLGYKITAATVFPLAQFFNLLQMALAIALPNAISSLAETLVSINRLQDFLMQTERPDLAKEARSQYLASYGVRAVLNKRAQKNEHIEGVTSQSANGTNLQIYDDNGGALNLGYEKTETEYDEDPVELKHVTAKWEGEHVQPTLSDVSLRVAKGQLCAVIGSVGAGKSSLLQLLLSELKHHQGEVKVNGTLSYASQEPWLFVATVRQNILFGLPYDPRKYAEVVRVCALEKDIKQFPRGDQTLVGERGVSLSGGQRARINLARAIYREADVYLLDDPLSAVDTAVGRQLFDNCINGYLQNHTRLLVTHQLHYLKAADIIIILNNGKVENVGTYDELVSSGEHFAKLLAALQEDKEEEAAVPPSAEQLQFKRSSSNRHSSRQSSIARDVTIPAEGDDDAEELDQEKRESGKQSLALYINYWKAGTNWCMIAVLCIVMVLGQLAATASDYWVTYWTNEEFRYSQISVPLPLDYGDSLTADPLKVGSTIAPYQQELDIHAKVGYLTTAQYLYIYSCIIVCCIVFTILRTIVFFKLSMNSSKGLHNQMFHHLLRGTMSFFESNTSGRILNRFSKDIGAVDELLPKVVMEMLQISLVGCSILVLVGVSMAWLLLPIIGIGIILYYIFMLFLGAAQAIKRIEGVTKSPVFSHLTSTLNGISTIRSTNSQNRFIKDFDEFQDVHTSSWNHYVTSACTIGFWLNSVLSLFLAVVVFSFLLVDGSTVDSGDCGLAISQTLILTGMLPYGMKQATEVISQMTSVERVLQYTTIETEKGLEKGEKGTPANWPTVGAIRLRGASLRYADDKPRVLDDLNIEVQPGWKVGIVGRTGAGKTSLISALFRLAKLEGVIDIDDVDTGSIALQDLRTKISIIPQEPVLFSASLRYNLDPFNKYDDVTLWEALADVELKDAVPNLDFLVTQGGSNFSLGQRQLICLARAILKRNKILVLDEATANVDPQTDAFIQRTIREKFADCTVLTIAHRLNTVVDSDRVLVMNFGRAVEFDHPYLLLRNRDGFFTSMVKETGPKMSRQLFTVAKDTFLANGGRISGDDELKEE